MGRAVRSRHPLPNHLALTIDMQFHPTNVAGAMVVTVDVHTDDRGLFARTFEEEAFAAAGLPTTWPQCSTSWNRRKGTLRGMHYQASPNPDPKLVRCTRGRIFDVALDIRRDSPTFLHGLAGAVAVRAQALYIPPGCAHGFLTLEDDCEILYMMARCMCLSLPAAFAGTIRLLASPGLFLQHSCLNEMRIIQTSKYEFCPRHLS